MSRRKNRRDQKSHILIHFRRPKMGRLGELLSLGYEIGTVKVPKSRADAVHHELRMKGARPYFGHSVHGGEA